MEPGSDINGYTVKEILSLFVVPALDDIRTTAALQNNRIDRLEAWRNRLAGALVILTAAMPVAVIAVTRFIT